MLVLYLTKGIKNQKVLLNLKEEIKVLLLIKILKLLIKDYL